MKPWGPILGVGTLSDRQLDAEERTASPWLTLGGAGGLTNE